VSPSARDLALETFVPMLRSLSRVLDKGAEHASAKNLELAGFVDARLAPDMFTLRQQVQLACHHATDAAVRLAGQEGTAPKDIGEGFEDLKIRILETIEQLQGAGPGAFEGAEDRKIVLPLPGADMVFEMTGYQFLRDWALPHFYFHVVTAYDILRHEGVDIGKRDYMGNVGGYIRQRPR
jgi:hypothetical protein